MRLINIGGKYFEDALSGGEVTISVNATDDGLLRFDCMDRNVMLRSVFVNPDDLLNSDNSVTKIVKKVY